MITQVSVNGSLTDCLNEFISKLQHLYLQRMIHSNSVKTYEDKIQHVGQFSHNQLQNRVINCTNIQQQAFEFQSLFLWDNVLKS